MAKVTANGISKGLKFGSLWWNESLGHLNLVDSEGRVIEFKLNWEGQQLGDGIESVTQVEDMYRDNGWKAVPLKNSDIDYEKAMEV